MSGLPWWLKSTIVFFGWGIAANIIVFIGAKMTKKIQKPKKPEPKPSEQEKSNVISIKDYLIRKGNKK